MEKFANGLYARMKEQLQLSAIQSETAVLRAEAAIRIVDGCIRDLKEFILAYEFGGVEEEVTFFKNVKPLFLSERIYHVQVFQIESQRPVGGKDIQRNYLQSIISSISVYLTRHHLLHWYYRTGRSDHDRQLFVRNPQSGIFNDDYTLDMDNRFSTPYGQRLAKFQAYEKVCDYTLAELDQLDNNMTAAGEDTTNAMFWTDSNTALIELIYSLHARGAINHGKTTPKQIVLKFEETFNVRLGNFYQVIKDIRLRKKIRTVYLHALIESSEKKMDDTDMDF